MSRPLRLEFPGAIYHVTARGNARNAIFLDNEDRELFLVCLGEVIARFRWLGLSRLLADGAITIICLSIRSLHDEVNRRIIWIMGEIGQ